jgi:hypothetical protein
MKSVFLTVAASPLVAADFAAVITQCGTWLTAAETNQGTKSTELGDATTTYGTDSSDMKTAIAGLEADLAEAEAKAKAAAEAAALEKEKEEKGKKDLANYQDMLETSTSGCDGTKKTLTQEIADLSIPVTQLEHLLMELNGESSPSNMLEHASLSQNAKATLGSTVGALKAKLTDDKLTKENSLAAAETNCANKKTELEGFITELSTVTIPGIQAELKAQNDANKEATADAAEANGDLSAKQKELTTTTSDFQAKKRELTEIITEETNRIAALKQTIAILKDVDRNSAFVQLASFLQTSAVISPGFLKMQDKTKPLLDLISKHTKRAEVRNLLTAAATSGRQSVDAFKKVHAMINELIDRLMKQNMADEASKAWCMKTENELTQVIKDLEKALQSATDEKSAADALVSSHKDTISTAKSDIDDARAMKVSTHETDVAEIKAAKDGLIATEKELQGIGQALVTIGEAPIQEAFKNEVLNMVKELETETEATLAEDKKLIMTEEQELEDHKDDYDQKIAAAEAKRDRTVLALEQKQGESLSLEDKMRALKSELGTNKGEFHTIFEDEKDGKCYEYVAMYDQRLVDRKAELAELGDAKDALTAYTKSIGIRFM